MNGSWIFVLSHCFVIYVLIPVILCLENLSPGPIAYLKENSNVTFKCKTNKNWMSLSFFDNGLRNGVYAKVIYKIDGQSCKIINVDTEISIDKYSAEACVIGQPVSFIVRYINSTYHNKTISCKAGSEEYVTTIKIRELLNTPTLNTTAIPSIVEGTFVKFTCTAHSIPRSVIEWHIGESKLTDVVTTSYPAENTVISTIKYHAKKVHDNLNLFCNASNSFSSLNSNSVNLDILYAPTVRIEPTDNPYIVYEGQNDVVMTCIVDDANPLNGITYIWNSQDGRVADGTVTIATVSKSSKGQYACRAKNVAGNSTIVSKLLNVQYGPVIQQIQDKNVTAGNNLIVRPDIVANPNSTIVWWTRLKDVNFKNFSQTLTINNIQKDMSDTYTCHAMNTLTPSNLLTLNRTSVNAFSVNVQYVPTIHMDPIYEPYSVYSGQENVTLRCIVDSANPLNGLKYHWQIPEAFTNGQTYTIKTVTKASGGQHTCRAENVIGNSSVTTKQIVVYYGPVLTGLQDTNVTEGSKLSMASVVDANPSQSVVVWWTRHNDTSFRRDGKDLIFNNTRREDSDNYTCNAMNRFTPSGQMTQNRTSKKTFFVNVQYVPSIRMDPEYDPLTLYSGQEHVILRCMVKEANPLKSIIYHWDNPGGVTKGQTCTIETVSEADSGEYRCRAANAIGNSSVNMKQIYVHYGPKILNISFQEDIVEGSNLKLFPEVVSNPMAGSVWWTKYDDANFRYNGSTFVISDIKRKASGNYTCHAMNTLTPSGMDALTMKSQLIFYVNVQYPPSTEIVEGQNITVIENSNVTLHCKVRAANPDITSISWYKNVNVTLSNTTDYKIVNVQRSAAGNYTCNAVNKIGIGTALMHISVFYGPDVKNLTVINGSTVQENSRVALECVIDSNPMSSIEWTFNGEQKYNVDLTEGRSYYYINEATCFHTGNYRCSATNTFFTQTYNTSKEIQLFVNCSPRLNIYMEQHPLKIGLPLGGILNISIHIVAYPDLTSLEWIFLSNNSNNRTYNNNSIFKSSLIEYTSHLYQENLTENDFGDYKLTVQNIVGSNNYTFHIVPEGPPEPSFIINSTCGTLTAVVFWVTSFNGGDIQKFSVIVGKDKKEDRFETNVFGIAKGEIKNTALTLSPGEYVFTIVGKNKYDSAMSSNTKSCTVKDSLKQGSDSVIAAGVGGGIGAAVLLIGTVTLILLVVKKRRIFKGKPDDGRKNLTDEDKDEDGLKDNPLYVTSQSCKNDSRPIYSQVDKVYIKDKCKNEVTEQGPVYSQVQKNTYKGKQFKDGKEKKNMKTSGKKQKDIEMGTVYENSDDIFQGKQRGDIYANTKNDNTTKQPTKENSYKPNKNKDGLIYADLELAPSGKRFVIRGIENRNNYAIIDLTKTAEPLPSDDENEEDEKNSQNMNANAE